MEENRLIVSVDDMPPYISISHEQNRIELDGYLGKLWKLLQSRLGFKTTVIHEEYRNGIAQYLSGQRDVVLYPSTVSTSETFNTFQFSPPVLSTWYSLYIKDSDEANSSESYIRNWSKGLWASTGLMVLIFVVLLYITLKVSLKFMKGVGFISSGETREKDELNLKCKNPSYYNELRTRNDSSLGNCFIIALAGFCSQGCALPSQLNSFRILLLAFLLFGLIMCNAYSALLVSQLTLRERFLPFTTLDEIADQAKEYALCIRNTSAPYSYFKVNSTTSVLKKKWAKIVNRKPCVSGIIPPEVMCAPSIAFLEIPAIMQMSISKNFKCKVSQLKGRYHNLIISFIIKKDLGETHELSVELIRYRELGILQHLIKRHLRQDDLSPAEDPVLQVTYDHIYGVIIAYSCFLGISFFILLLEMFYYNLKNRWDISKRKRKQRTFNLRF